MEQVIHIRFYDARSRALLFIGGQAPNDLVFPGLLQNEAVFQSRISHKKARQGRTFVRPTKNGTVFILFFFLLLLVPMRNVAAKVRTLKRFQRFIGQSKSQIIVGLWNFNVKDLKKSSGPLS